MGQITGRRVLRSIGAAGFVLASIFIVVASLHNGQPESVAEETETTPRGAAAMIDTEAVNRPAASVAVEFSLPPEPQPDLPAQVIDNRDDGDESPIGWPTFAEAEQRFTAEARDQAWAGSAESAIVGTLSLIPDLSLMAVEVECRESMCRLRLLFPAGAQTTYALRQIHLLSSHVGLGPVTSDTGREADGLPLLRLFLRRLSG